MKKLFTSLVLVQLIFCLNLKAQNTDVLRNELNTIFQNIDKSQIPTGYLEEYGPGFAPLSAFNGVLTDSNLCDFTAWQLLYGQIRASKIYGSTNLSPLPVTTAAINAAGNSQVFALPLLLMDYNTLNPYAIQQNLFTISNTQLFDVPGRIQSPYLLKTLFSAAPVVNTTNTGAITILVKQELFFTNTAKAISNIQVDFNDGNGFTLIPLNSAYTKIYVDTGYKRWKIKLTCTDNSSYQCYAVFYVKQVTTSNVGARYGDNPDIVEKDFPAIPGPGSFAHSGGKVTVWYSKQGTERTLNKPFIIVEGYDASGVAPSLKEPLDYLSFITLLRDQPVGYDFASKLDDEAGYDLVFLDFKNGTDNILRNVALFKEVLGWVNTQKASAPNPQDNVVLGLSMGGLVIRYALAEMTKNNIPHGTRLIISHDSPHQGANTPLGVQYLTRFLATRGGIGGLILNEIDKVKQGNDLLDEPASGELLIYKATSHNTYTSNTFLNSTYRNMITFSVSDPQPTYEFIAVSSGSQCGNQIFAPGSNIIYGNGLILAPLPFPFHLGGIKCDVYAKALPSSGNSTTIAHLVLKASVSWFFGLLQKTWVIDSFDGQSPTGALPWDGAPGGTMPTSEKKGNISFNVAMPMLNVTANSVNYFCFVPVTSSLDITTVNAQALTASYFGGTNPANPSRASDFIAQQSFPENGSTIYNSRHRFFTARNANWIFDKMQGINSTLNCTTECYSPVLELSYLQAGCNDAIITCNITNGNSYLWQTSGDLLINGTSSSISTTTNSINITGTTGSVMLTVNSHCSTLTGGLDYNPLAREIQGLYPEYIPGDHVSVSVNTTQYDLNYKWYVNDILVKEGPYATSYCTCNYETPEPRQCGENSIRVEVETSCGTTIAENNFIMYCGYGMISNVTMYPNPASDQVTLSLNQVNNSKIGTKLQDIKEVKILNKYGNIKRVQKFPANSQKVTLNLNILPLDIYFVEVSDGKNKIILRLSLQK